MVEKLNSTVISSLKACTSMPTDWVDCLQSLAMSIRSQPHESTGISPYEMMFGVPMRLPTELEDGDIPSVSIKGRDGSYYATSSRRERRCRDFRVSRQNSADYPQFCIRQYFQG